MNSGQRRGLMRAIVYGGSPLHGYIFGDGRLDGVDMVAEYELVKAKKSTLCSELRARVEAWGTEQEESAA